MKTLNQLVSRFRKTLKNQAPLLARPFGLDLLNKAQTEALLKPARAAVRQGRSVKLSSTYDFTDEHKLIFGETKLTTANAYVWSCPNPDQCLSQLRNGGIRIGRTVLDTDFGTSAVFKDLFNTRKRAVLRTPTLIAPWSHYWGGYYDYLFFVAAKLCRIRDTMPEDLFAQAVVAYPLLHTSFERELLDRLGIRPENRIDSRTHAVQFDTVILGNTDSWFYPNEADVFSLKKHLTVNTPTPVPGITSERIYVRRAGRRRVLNEDALVRMLERYGFSIVADEPRSLAEQMALYSHASFIIGPHGASFANLLWCQPGTQLLELFAPNYTPDYFRYLAHGLGLHYAAYCHGPLENHHFSYVNADMTVALDPLEKHLNRLFETNMTG